MQRQRFNPRQRFHGAKKMKSLGNRELLEAIRAVEVIQKEHIAQKEVIVPTGTFTKYNLVPGLLQNVLYKEYKTPTPIQEKAIPPILDGRDVIGIANTGTGKTAAFLIPLVNKVALNKTEKVFILAPTRELALQIYEELRSFTKGLGITSILCIGGMSIGRQKSELRLNPHFVIGTPGRIRDLVKERILQLGVFHTVVLDEADRMVDIGFIQDIKYFISLLPPVRQSLFFSATISGKVKEILHAFVHDAITASVEQQEAATNISQDIVRVEKGVSKIDTLHNLLAQDGFEKVMIFGRTKWGIQKLTDELVRRGFRALAIHGNKSQNQRQRALEQFKANNIQVLLATDVASRGLDIDDVTHVINYDMPASMEDYIHRIGRTGRANKKGQALTFVE